MMNLVRGDKDNLEGKVIIFSRFKDENETRIFAVYATTNALDFFERIGAPEEIANEIVKEQEEKIEELKKKGGLESILPLYAVPIPIKEEDLYIGENDVLDVGEFSNPGDCTKAVLLGVEFYLLNFGESIRKKHKIGKRKGEKKEEPKVSYKDITKDDLRKYMTNNFVVRILDCCNSDRQTEGESLRQSLIDFSANAPFASDVLELANLLQKNPDLRLIGLYLDKINAINKEDYETATKCRDGIKGLRK